MLRYHARYYDPALARFVSADTVAPGATGLSIRPDKQSNGPANPTSLNRYAYVNNNPVRYTDPTGHCIFAVVDTLVCAAIAGEIIADVVVPVVVGSLIIAGAYEAGGALGRAHAAASSTNPEPSALKEGKDKHKQLEQEYLDDLPADRRPYVDVDKTRIDPETGERFRPDIVDHLTGDVVDFKPETYNDGGLLQRQAQEQADSYAERLNRIYGDQRKADGLPPYRGRVIYYPK